MLEARAPSGSTVVADRGYDAARFVDEVGALKVASHIARKARYNAADVRTMLDPGYEIISLTHY